MSDLEFGGFSLGSMTSLNVHDAVQRASTPPSLSAGQGAGAKNGAKEIEGYFIGYLLQVMRQTVPKGLFGKSLGEQFYSFYDQEIGRLAAERGGLGLADMIEADLKIKGPVPTERNLSSSDGAPPIQGPR